MKKYLLILFILFNFNLLAQVSGTLFNVPDSLAMDSVSVVSDSLSISDSTRITKEVVKPDSLAPIQGTPLASISEIINKKTFLFNNYRYSGDFLRSFSINFVKELGFMGQPDETFIYGVGNGGISFMEDGVFWNDRYTNSLDLNRVQSEDIDSIEIVPSPRGFLYGPYNNPVTVNFIMKDFLSPVPYSRIRYYEGPDGEAMFDGKFNAQVAKRWGLSFQLTNRNTDSSFANNEFSTWQANTKLKYYLSNKLNFTAIYSFVDADIGLNGGINIDSIASITSDVNSILYDRQSAPVIFPNRGQSIINHNFSLRTQAAILEKSNTDLIFYYRIARNEITDFQDTLNLNLKNDNKTFGINLKHYQRIGLFSFNLFGIFEQSNGDYDDFLSPSPFTSKTDWEFTEISGGLDLSLHLLDDKLIPSLFYKYVNQSKYINRKGVDYVSSITDRTEGFSGIGTDIKYIVDNEINFYAGASVFQHEELINNSNDDTKTFETGGRYNNSNFIIDLKYFTRTGSAAVPQNNFQPSPVVFGNLSGLGLKFDVNYWKILIETNTSYYFDAEDDQLLGVPELQFVGGLFLNGFFFDDNLYLKAGVQLYYTGTNNIYSDVWRNIITVDPSNRVDITVAGEIKGVAIVYFNWENLFDNEYFITPYYPMLERNIRFGLSWELFD